MEALKNKFYELPIGLQKVLRPIIQTFLYLLSLRVVPGPITYGHNKLYTSHNADFLKNTDFEKAYNTANNQTGYRNPAPWRAYVNCWAIRRAVREGAGDLVECGTWHGTTALAGMLYSGFFENNRGKKFYLVDSWEGVDESNLAEGEKVRYARAKKDMYSGLYPSIIERFGDKQGVVLVKGFVPEALKRIDSTLVSYLHIDMNSAYPEVEALKFFWPLLNKGAVVVLDDYGFKGHEVQKMAIDKICVDLGSEVLTLPTGQGIIIKS